MSCTHKVIAYNKPVIAKILIANENGDIDHYVSV